MSEQEKLELELEALDKVIESEGPAQGHEALRNYIRLLVKNAIDERTTPKMDCGCKSGCCMD